MNWLFDFNKGHKEERGLVSDLAKKIKNAKKISHRVTDYTDIDIPGYIGSEVNAEKYVFDNVEVVFVLMPVQKLQLIERGKVVYEMNCEWKQYDKWQQQRFTFFSGLLERARGRYEEYQKNISKVKKINDVSTKIKAEQEKKKSGQEKQLLYIQNARNKLK